MKEDSSLSAQDPSSTEKFKKHVLTQASRRHRRHEDTKEDYETTKSRRQKKTELHKITDSLNTTCIGEEQPHKLQVLERSLLQGYNTSSRHNGQQQEALCATAVPGT